MPLLMWEDVSSPHRAFLFSFYLVLIVFLSLSSKCCFTEAIALPISNVATNPFRDKLDTTARRLKDGCEVLFQEWQEAKRIRTEKGKDKTFVLSYSAYLLTEKSKEDMWKLAKLLLMIPLAKQFFLYAYVISPIISSSLNAWVSWPSTFELSSEKQRKSTATYEKRLQAMIKLIHTMNAARYSDLDGGQAQKGESKIDVLLSALNQNQLTGVLAELKPFLYVEKSTTSEKSQIPNLKGVPGNLVKDILNALGGDGVPNIFLINRLNVNAIGGILHKISQGDKQIHAIGVDEMTDEEVNLACKERFILCPRVSVHAPKFNSKEARQQLQQWIDICFSETSNDSNHPRTSVKGKIPKKLQKDERFVNPLNRRLAMIGYYTCKECKTAEFTKPYRVLLGK